MSYPEMIFRNKDNFHYKFPQYSCKRCLNYPCLSNMEVLKSDFAKFGCRRYKDANVFEWKK